MRKYLFWFLLLVYYAFGGDRYFVIDSSLYRIEHGQMIILKDNIVDIFYISDKPHFVQWQDQEVNVLTFRSIGFIPFIRSNIYKVLSIRGIDRYVGTVAREGVFFIVTDKSLQAIGKDYKISKKIEFRDFEAAFTYSELIVLKNLRSGVFYIYEIDRLDQPIFTVNYSHLLQILKNDHGYFLLALSHIYENQYELLVDLVRDNACHSVLRKKIKVFYDSTFYLVRINSQYLLLQEKGEATLYRITDSLSLMSVKKIPSYYSYFVNGYLFTINQSNLIVYYFRDGEFDPVFSIPNVSFIFYSRDRLYYLSQDSIAGVWKLNSMVFKDDRIYRDNEEIVLYSMPEEVIPI
ncbi:MAG: hypothetical protein RMJ51_00495 [Candidatus Calescibacterium sp.]|nr:hypothetical protein [Candidatus Calescibacterium sp.]MCX7972691.1 hypothetical protein [bacterium]MDW8194712.1 hypothetical protein [Candidatus Calescibacterium sp.]